MKTLFRTSAAIAAISIFVSTGHAADLDYERSLELAVSGKVESWVGGSFITSQSGDADFDDESYGVGGGSVVLGLPLGPNLSIQSDVSWERNFDSISGDVDDELFSHSFQIASHISWRDPNRGLFGVFGGIGTADFDSSDEGTYRFVGGEAQVYLDNFTFYAQGGTIWSVSDDDQLGALESVDDSECCGNGHAFFVRGVGRWFVDPVSRLQFEGSYANGDVDVDDDTGNMDIFEWGVRYDRLVDLPILGDTNLFLGYRGNRFDKGGSDDGAFTEHTVMVGTSISFGADNMANFDRVGASLDTPNIGRWVIAGEQVE